MLLGVRIPNRHMLAIVAENTALREGPRRMWRPTYLSTPPAYG